LILPKAILMLTLKKWNKTFASRWHSITSNSSSRFRTSLKMRIKWIESWGNRLIIITRK
jgi:hypothetical protein